MEEALSILWTYARRQPIESNGKTIVATISQSIAAIRIIMRLEGWLQKSEKVKDKSEKPAAPAVATSRHQGSCIKADNKSCHQASKPHKVSPRWCELVARTSSLMQAYGSSPHKVSPPYPYIAADLHKNTPRWCELVAHTSSLMQAYGSSPHKVSPPYSYIAADLHKNAPLMEPPMIRHHVANDNYRDDGERLISSRPPPF